MLDDLYFQVKFQNILARIKIQISVSTTSPPRRWGRRPPRKGTTTIKDWDTILTFR